LEREAPARTDCGDLDAVGDDEPGLIERALVADPVVGEPGCHVRHFHSAPIRPEGLGSRVMCGRARQALLYDVFGAAVNENPLLNC